MGVERERERERTCRRRSTRLAFRFASKRLRWERRKAAGRPSPRVRGDGEREDNASHTANPREAPDSLNRRREWCGRGGTSPSAPAGAPSPLGRPRRTRRRRPRREQVPRRWDCATTTTTTTRRRRRRGRERAGARARGARDSFPGADRAEATFRLRIRSAGFESEGALSGLGNDPSAGSPTETLLRLLLPLNDQVWSSSRRTGTGVAPRPEANPRTSLNRSIGSSDGRCVQRAGT